MAEFFIGTSGWNYPHWEGLFYPEDWPKRRWLEYYATRFRTVEVNATFYRTFRDETYRAWRERAPEGFRYVLKAPRYITHRLYLVEAEEPIRRFRDQASLLGDRLGLVLLQLAPSTPYEPERLRRALLAFGEPCRVAVEFRHSRWLTDETRELLREVGAAFCTADSPRSRLCDWVTSAVAYIRLHGRKRWYAHNYTDEELAEIAALARRMAAQGAEEVYIFFNNDYEGYAPQNALTLRAMLEGEATAPAAV